MSAIFIQTIENIKPLSADEKALVAHCLISSLESHHDEDVDFAWADLAEQRYLELKSGAVVGKTWVEIKAEVLGASSRIENLLQKSWIWCYFPLIFVK